MRIACSHPSIAVQSVHKCLCFGQGGKVAPLVITISCPQQALLYMPKDVFLSLLCGIYIYQLSV